MKRERTRGSQAGVSLFPFLAVLLCAMGALIVLLVVITRQARLAAVARAEASLSQSAPTAEVRQELEMIEWRIEQIVQSRDATAAGLSDRRAELSHLEDHSRRLREEIETAARTLESLVEPAGIDDASFAARNAQLEGLEAEIRAAEAAQSERPDRVPRTFAVVPYVGPRGTRRRPMYVECRRDGIVLQPEGIRLTEDDFDGPLGPRNPLAAALLAEQEYLNSQRVSAETDPGRPYPLFLIRPDGIAAYYVALSAMAGWGSEHGYELVDADWQLAYPPSDPRLEQIAHQAVRDARMRQEILARAAPRQFGSLRNGLSAAGRGGSYGREAGGTGPASTGDGISGGEGTPFGTGVGRSLGVEPGLGGERPQPTANGSAGAVVNREATPAEGGPPRGSVSGSTGNRRDGEGPVGQGSASLSSADGTDRKPHSQSDAEGTLAGESGGSPGNRQAGSAGAESTPGASFGLGTPSSLAEERGKDWGIRERGIGAVPITRPIIVDCRRDRFWLPADTRRRADAAVIPIDGSTESAVDGLVKAVWKRIDSWGMAGRGMYWKPVLKLQVSPGGETRAEELTALLEGSGIEVRVPSEMARSPESPPFQR
jgi:hypothetical protein